MQANGTRKKKEAQSQRAWNKEKQDKATCSYAYGSHTSKFYKLTNLHKQYK